jgi:hypothetical protein
VLFAVILLGIGFIMIAGIFPAAIQQTGAAADETAGQAVAQSALALIQEGVNSGAAMQQSVLPWPGGPYCRLMEQWQFVTVNGVQQPEPQLGMVGGLSSISPDGANLVWNWGLNTEDRRYSWIAFYTRAAVNNVPLPFANVIVLAMKNANFPYYVCPPPVGNQGVTTTYQLVTTPSIPVNGIGGQTDTNAQLCFDSSGNPAIAFSTPAVPNLVTGAFVIIQSGPNPGLGNIPPVAGRIYRLGAQESTLPTGLSNNPSVAFQLQPGTDFQSTMELPYTNPTTQGPPISVQVYIVGRAPARGNSGASTDFTGLLNGANQDIAIATGIVRIPAGQ